MIAMDTTGIKKELSVWGLCSLLLAAFLGGILGYQIGSTHVFLEMLRSCP